METSQIKHKVQVWVLSGDQVLIFKTNQKRGSFWQPITGSVEGTETPTQAALRELYEETGFNVNPSQMINLNYSFEFQARGFTFEEHAFFISLDKTRAPRVDPNEHDEFQWVGVQEALSVIRFESNREVLRKIILNSLLESTG